MKSSRRIGSSIERCRYVLENIDKLSYDLPNKKEIKELNNKSLDKIWNNEQENEAWDFLKTND